MGYNTQNTGNTINLTARLTPLGRKLMVSSNNSLITTFSLSDDDANYNTSLILPTGKIPALGGEIGPNSTVSNSTTQNVKLKSFLILNNNGILKKAVESQSTTISSEIISNGQVTISGANITHDIINRNDTATDSLVNLYYSFGLPLDSTKDAVYTGKTQANGGFSDTALSGIAQSKIVVLGINNSVYGESLDGKQIKLDLVTSAGTYNIYSTFQNKGASLKTEDTNYRDTSPVTSGISSNIAFLFSDTILTPNGGSGSLSWATGFGSVKPFSVNSKQLWNLQTDTNISISADTIVGIAYLDKGFIVLTHPTIVTDYGTTTTGVTTGSTITFDSISTDVSQNIIAIANRGEFGTSTNTTFGGGDVPRISSIALYDNVNNIIALGKTDKHVTKNVNEFKAFSIKITL